MKKLILIIIILLLSGTCFTSESLEKKIYTILGLEYVKTNVKYILFNTKKDFHDNYYKLYGKKFCNLKGQNKVLAFYMPQNNTIYAYKKHLTAGVKIHELTHAILNQNYANMTIEMQELICMETERRLK